MPFQLTWLVYGVPIVLIVAVYWGRGQMRASRDRARRDEHVAAGLTEPASLHPLIDPATCLGCGTCVSACPEGSVLGIIHGKAQLVAPTECIGHGACREACPTGAISLVFGTATRGVDLPLVNADFSTSVPGIYIAGELGGMGLVRNAVNQGQQAMAAIAGRLGGAGGGSGNVYDVIIVGAGPAGFSASLAAKEKGLRCLALEQESFGGTVAHYPRGKIVMTAPMYLPLVGKVNFTEISKEQLISFWNEVREQQSLDIHYSERVRDIRGAEGAFAILTEQNNYRARAVLLAIGRRGTPRKLGAPGEELPKVVYRLIDPEQYRGQSVLVTGGGDSALEAAASIAEEPGTTVTLSYRGEAFGRAKQKNRERVAALADEGRLTVLFNSIVGEITEDAVSLKQDGTEIRLANDAVIICAGGVLPTQFLKDIGITVETKYGTA